MEGILGSVLKMKAPGKAGVADSEAATISRTPGWTQQTLETAQDPGSKEVERVPVKMIYDVGIGVEEDWTEDPTKKESCLDISADSTYRAYVVGLFLSIGLVVVFGWIRNQVSLSIVLHVLVAVVVVFGAVIIVSIRVVQRTLQSVCWFLYSDDEDEENMEDPRSESAGEFVEIVVSSSMVLSPPPPPPRYGGYTKQEMDDPEGRPWVKPTGPKIFLPSAQTPEQQNKMDVEYIEVIMANYETTSGVPQQPKDAQK